MAKYNFDELHDFADYVEKYFSGDRKLNMGNDDFERKAIKRDGDVAYMKFEVNENFDAVATCIKVPAQDEWLCFFPKFSHKPLEQMHEVLSEVNNDNHERNDRHPTSEEKTEEEDFNGMEEWESL